MSTAVGLRIAKNSLYSLARTVIALPLTLTLTPYTMRHIGKEEFGIWALVGVISSYVQLSDFGITESLIKFIAEYQARKDARQLNQLINTALVTYLVVCVAGCSVFIFILPFLVDKVLNIPSILQGKAAFVFAIAICLFFCNLLMSVFNSLIIGFQEMGYSNLISLMSTIMTATGTFYCLHLGYGLNGLIFNNVLVTVFVIGSNVLVACRLFPSMRINPYRYFSRETLSKIFSFSWKVQVSTVSNLFVYQLDRVLLSHYLGLTAVTYYEIANRVAYQAKAFLTSILKPMVPATSSLEATNEQEKITGLYNRSFKYMVVTTVPLSFLIIALAHPFVMTWMGQGYELSAYTMQFLMVAYMINLMPGPAYFILSGINKPEVAMRSSVLSGVINLFACLALIKLAGYYGIVAGITISILISGSYFFIKVHQNLPGLSWGMYGRTLVRPVLVSTSLGAGLWFADNSFHLHGYAELVSLGAVFLLAFASLMMAGGYFDSFDRSIMKKLIPSRAFRSF